MQKMIDIVKIRSSIERQENNNRKDDIIETIQKKKIDKLMKTKKRNNTERHSKRDVRKNRETTRQ